MHKSLCFAFPQADLPVPNELLYDILLDLIIEDLHRRIVAENPDVPNVWNALVVLPHVSRAFRATSIRIYASALSLPVGKCGDWFLERVHRRLERLPWLPPLRPKHLDLQEELQAIEKFEVILDGVYKKLPGLLRVYGNVAHSTFVCRQVMRRGFEEFIFESYPGALKDVASSLTEFLLDAVAQCENIKPVRLASLASELVISHCAANLLTFSLWSHSDIIQKFTPLTGPCAVEGLTFALTAMESLEAHIVAQLPRYLIAQHCPDEKILTRTMLEDSGAISALEGVRGMGGEDPHGLIMHAEKILKAWGPLLQLPTRDVQGGGRMRTCSAAAYNVT